MLVVACVLCFSSFLRPLLANKELHFPRWFKFGAATSSYQIEGSWNVSDKTPSTWDDYTHTQPHRIKDHSNGDVACDSYNQYEKDIEMAEQLGLDFYRFSISWPRLLPKGFRTRISADGRQYYDNLINGLLDRGIEPMVTLYHSDMPKIFQDLGGWANPEMAEWFADYADVAFSLYGDRVKLWITINEPLHACDSSSRVLGVVEPFLAPYLCTKTLLMAHAKAYHNYKKNYKPMYQGKVGIAHTAFYFGAKTQDDSELTELFRQYNFGRFMHPIHSKSGGWPAIVVELLKNISSKEGFPRSRLPPLSKHEVEFIRGTNDFFGLNYYTSRTVRRAKAGEKRPEYLGNLPEFNAIFESYPNSTATYPEEYSSYPEGLRAFIAWVTKNYGVQDILITENGYTSYKDDLNDFDRITYIEKHLEKILLCIYEDGARIHGYTYWSLMDNFEWKHGYTAKFGLYNVDFSDVDRKRTPRLSAQYYSYVIKSRQIDSNKWKSQMEDTNDNKKPIADVA
ncbi:myrosinase 1 isoform X1 [Bombyx mori]|uniref:Myrosinase 1-like n=1 Tax=Bombyx mori TaxID=7091 RepID=A0A8R2HMQ9_BOMMO|nr:myrosinase 1 [Bombyx mori]